MKTTEYMSLKRAAEKWRSKPWYIEKACEDGQIPNAAKVDGEWIIPADMERPQMHIQQNEPKPSPVQHGTAYKDQIYRLTMRGFPDFNVMTKKIGRTTYYVYSSFAPTARQTITEKTIGLALREFEGKIPPDVKKSQRRFARNQEKTFLPGNSCGNTISINLLK